MTEMQLEAPYRAKTAARRLIGFAGWSGSGKTTLVASVLPVLTARGWRVSTIKHAHHAFDIDQPGKDSYRHRAAGATEVMISSGNRWALMHELRGAPEPELDELLSHLSPVDLVIIEGFKHSAYPKIEVHRPAVGKPPLYPQDPTIVAVASDAALEAPLPLLPLARPDLIADFIMALPVR
jgi:molybdopterin-guanine dinucleotide biosynthesis protein B